MKTDLRVPFLDLPAQHRPLRQEVRAALDPLFENAAFVGGKAVTDFETAFAAAQEAPHAVGVKSGTSALQLTMEALGLGAGDEVLVPAFTFIATAAPIVRVGALPVFVDVDPETACIDPADAESRITDRTRAIVPVHLYGHPADMDGIMTLARKYDLRVLEDCAQSHLARLNGTRTGGFGTAAAYSFYPSKNLGAAGDAGAVTTADAGLADRVRRLANHGRAGRYNHDFLGSNERLDAIQAAWLTVGLRHLEAWTEARREAAARYQQSLAGLAPLGAPITLPVTRPGAEPVHHLYVIRHPRREELAAALQERGVDTGTHYPETLPAQKAFRDLGLGDAHCPRAEDWARTCLALPLFPGITEEQQAHVTEVLRSLEG